MPLSDKTYQVFVSSTYKDMKAERQAAVEAILASGNIPAGMELFAAGDQSQLDVIKRWIKASDIFLLILGGRYGSIEQESGNSYIHVEYQYAIDNEIPFFAIVMDEEWLRKQPPELFTDDNERANGSKYNAFKKLVMSKMKAQASNSDQIKLAVFQSLRQLIDDHNPVGWVRADKAADPEVANQMAKLIKDNEALRAKYKSDEDPKADRCIEVLGSITFSKDQGWGSSTTLEEAFCALVPLIKQNILARDCQQEFSDLFKNTKSKSLPDSEFHQVVLMLEGLHLVEPHVTHGEMYLGLTQLGKNVFSRILFHKYVKPKITCVP